MDETDPCLRCGYDLRGIPDSSACPECGLLAARSRMPTDELRNARPKWLLKLSLGIWLMLAATVPLAAYFYVLVTIPFPSLRMPYPYTSYTYINETLPAIALPVSVGLFTLGIYLLTSAEGNLPRDRVHRARRRDMRILALLLLLPIAYFTDVVLFHDVIFARAGQRFLGAHAFTFPLIFALVILFPLPLTLALYLRDMARRVSSRRMIEHCGIVGVGWTLCVVVCLLYLLNYDLDYFNSLSLALMIAQQLTILVIMLFGIWSAFALVIFAREFAHAARNAKASWALADLSAFNDGSAPPAAETPPAADHAKA